MEGNLFFDGPYALDPEDCDHLLWMIAESHKPFVPRRPVGDISSEWASRWRKLHKPSSSDLSRWDHSPGAQAARLLHAAYANEKPAEPLPEFPWRAACDALCERWPGLGIGAPEAKFNSSPEIVELGRLRAELRNKRNLHPIDRLPGRDVLRERA